MLSVTLLTTYNLKPMKPYKLILFLLTFLPSLSSYSQPVDQVEMADVLRQDGKIYTVVIGVVVILTGMVILLLRVDRKIFRIENEIKIGKKD